MPLAPSTACSHHPAATADQGPPKRPPIGRVRPCTRLRRARRQQGSDEHLPLAEEDVLEHAAHPSRVIPIPNSALGPAFRRERERPRGAATLPLTPITSPLVCGTAAHMHLLMRVNRALTAALSPSPAIEFGRWSRMTSRSKQCSRMCARTLTVTPYTSRDTKCRKQKASATPSTRAALHPNG